MPIIKSAEKRVRKTKKAAIRNAKTKRNLREAVKAFIVATKKGKAKEILEAQNRANSAIDTAVKKEVIHKNKAARKKKQLAKNAKASGAKIGKATKAKSTAKTTSKKTVKQKTVKKTNSKPKTVKKPTAKPLTKK